MGNVLVAYAHTNDVAHSWAQSVNRLIIHDQGRHIGPISNVRCSSGNLVAARNAMMQELLEGDCEWLFMVDTDMGFQANALDMLMASADPIQRPIVGGLCFAQKDLSADGRSGYRFTPMPTIFDWVKMPDDVERFAYRSHYPVNGLVQCDGTGAAFVLIHRSVGEQMFNKYGPTWFDRTDDGDGLMSEDLSFFKRWMDMGGRGGCHVNTAVRVTHQKTAWLAETDFFERLGVPPATERVDVIVPVLHRPQNVRPLLETLRASTGLAEAWFVCDRDDKVEQQTVRDNGGHVIRCDGSFAEKVNHAYAELAKGREAAPWVFLTGDDVLFQPSWLDHALYVAHEYGGQVVGTNDLGNPRVTAGDHATHMLISRRYVDEVGATFDAEPGKVCGPYRHWFVDDELVLAAKQRGVWQMALGSIVEHMHPLWGKGQGDDVYAKGQESAEADKALFEQRARKFLGMEA